MQYAKNKSNPVIEMGYRSVVRKVVDETAKLS